MMMRTRDVRRQIVERVLKGIPIRSHFGISLNNAKESLLLSCKPETTTLFLKPSSDQEDGELAHFDIKTELDEFEKDLNFLKFIQSDDVYNVEQFINVRTLYEVHTQSLDPFSIPSWLGGQVPRRGHGPWGSFHGRRSLQLLFHRP